jgi:integrase
MKVKFYLNRPDSDTETAIFARVSHSGQMKVYTGISVLPKYWNRKTHRVRQSPSYRAGSAINTRLDNIKGLIDKVFYDYQNEYAAEPSPATFRKLIDAGLGRSNQKKLNFFEYFQDYIDRTRAGQRLTAKGAIIKPEKAKHYGTAMNALKDFEGTWGKKLDFDTIDLDFYQDFTGWMRKKGYSENYVGEHIKNIKAVLNEATDRGANTNLAYKSKRFIITSEDVDNIALTEKELQEILSLDLSGNPGHERVRDLFIVGCHTGMRFGDGASVTADNIKGDFIDIIQGKTGKPVAIPIHPVVKAIIAKYDGNLPAAISNQKTNDYLKDICQQVDMLKQPVSKTRTKGGVKVTVNYKKWEIVSSHTARRTFATNAYLQGIPTITIMAITGHKTEKSFLKYIKVTSKEHAKIMAAHWAKNQMKAV